MLIDTHCHLDAPEFAADRAAVAERARAAGVGAIVNPSIAARTFADTVAVREAFGCLPAFGMHPMYLAEHRDEHLDLLRETLVRQQAVAVGEIGLDFFVPGLDAERQIALLDAQLRIARELDLPVLLHVRRAVDAVLKCLRRQRVRGGIAHAFNGSAQQAQAFIDLGFKLGFGGAMTYPRALNLRRLAADLPLESIVLETDAPDMPPEWLNRGRNEPAELPRIARLLADLRGLPFEEVVAATTANALSVLNIHQSENLGGTSEAPSLSLPPLLRR
ncbi:TatD DNase family protein [Formivibrio citricus]|uniref:TatD DNase family protein n=2 Tax=Formivibrio citricus TaxID=83765 RepID=A0A1I5B4B6_9NEIS|nr:TatD DNase family protein [Formivibrio citricus]